jgi:indolepyruvate ferredoxin oxidoreductase
MKKLNEQFEGNFTLRFHLAPPSLARHDDKGHLVKKAYGPWMMKAFRVLARLKGLRGGAFDVFGRTEERRTERALIGEYEALVNELLSGLNEHNVSLAVQLAELPQEIRGYGHVKEQNLAATRIKWTKLLTQWREGGSHRAAA